MYCQQRFEFLKARSLFALIILNCVLAKAMRLGRLNIDRSLFTVTGFSTGGDQTIQFHFSHSSKIHGVGIMAGSPYLYGSGNPVTNFITVDPEKSGINFTNVINKIESYKRDGKIDPTRFLAQSRVFIFQGEKDSIVHPANAEVIRKTYEYYGATNISFNLHPSAEHGVVANHVGGPCSTINPLHYFINDCMYDAIFEMYNYLYGGNLRKPPLKSVGTVLLKGDFLEFDQSSFFGDISPRAASMDTVGFLYIPSGCRSGVMQCKVSFALHGCGQPRLLFGDKFARTTGYLEVAELNDIILVFPQAIPYLKKPFNPPGCWDFWGFTGSDHGNKLGPQTIIMQRMMDRIYNG